VKLTYELTGKGWAECSVACGEVSVAMTVSYLHDSLGELAAAALAVRNGIESVTVLMMDEPGEHELTFRRVDERDVEVQVDWYPDWKSWGFDVRAERRLLGRTSRASVCERSTPRFDTSSKGTASMATATSGSSTIFRASRIDSSAPADRASGFHRQGEHDEGSRGRQLELFGDGGDGTTVPLASSPDGS
jgi:hypothetical protein